MAESKPTSGMNLEVIVIGKGDQSAAFRHAIDGSDLARVYADHGPLNDNSFEARAALFAGLASLKGEERLFVIALRVLREKQKDGRGNKI